MASTVSVRLARLAFPGSQSVPVAKSVPYLAESITSGASSAQGSTAIGPAKGWQGLFWIITNSGGNVWVKFGANPTAAAGDDHLIPDGAVDVAYAVSGATEKIAVKDV